MRKTVTSDFYCVCCGKKGIPLSRKEGRLKKGGHLKKIYCIYCQEQTNHAEVKPCGDYTYEDFREEFELGRYIDGQKIETKNLMSCSQTNCKYNKSGKCWNSNYSYDCKYRNNINNILKKENR